MRCFWNDEVLLDRCEGSETVVDSAPAVDEACYLECRSAANAVTEACRGFGDFGYGDDLCVASGQAQFDSCWERCPASAEATPLAAQP